MIGGETRGLDEDSVPGHRHEAPVTTLAPEEGTLRLCALHFLIYHMIFTLILSVIATTGAPPPCGGGLWDPRYRPWVTHDCQG